MKKILLAVLFSLVFFALCACVTPPDTPDTPSVEYPEGAIPLTAENFSEYFEIKVKTDLEEDYITDEVGVHKLTHATTYVAIVPKNDYLTVEGTLKLSIHSAIGRNAAQTYPDFRIVTFDQQLHLDEDIVNKSYKLTAQQDKDYAVLKGSDTATVKEVQGYLIEGTRENPTELEKLTDADRKNSIAVMEELLARIEAYEATFANAGNYSYKSRGVHILKSLYGDGRDVTNSANYGKNPYLVDLTNHSYVRFSSNYYLKDGEFLVQHKNEFGLVKESESPYTEQSIIEEATPDFSALTDTGAIFVRGETEGIYYAYVTLSTAQNDAVKNSIKDTLDNWGCTSRQNEFVLKYTYAFQGDDFTFDATVTYQNPRYHVEYVDIRVSVGFDLYHVGTTEIPLYRPGKDDFALEESYEDMKKYPTGLVEITPDTERIYYTLFQNASQYPTSTEENYLPIRIQQSGLYEFKDADGQPLDIYTMEDRRPCYDYFEAGLYYIRFSMMNYGATRAVMRVSSIPLNDYADMENPIPQEGNTLSVNLESVKDKQAFSFTPEESGIYRFSDTEANISFALYQKGQTKDYISACNKPYLTLYMEKGVQYIITAKIYPRNVGEDETLTQVFTLTYLGAPMSEPPLMTGDYQDIFLGNRMFSLFVNIEKAGYYTVDFLYGEGYENPYGHFVDEEGYTDKRVTKIKLPDGKEAYYLPSGEYRYRFSASANSYLKGKIRLITEALAQSSEETVTLSYDAYTTLKVDLPTISSKVTFYFTIPDGANLLCPSSHFMTLYRADGTRVPHQQNNFTDVFFDYTGCYRWTNLPGGTYHMTFENTNVSGEAMSASYLLRLQASDEHEMQHYYMQAHPECKRENIHILSYLGMYYGYRVALIKVDGVEYGTAEWTESVGSYGFVYPDGNRLCVIKDGKEMTLSEMYEAWPEELASSGEDAIRYFYEAYKKAFPERYEEQ